MGSSASVDGDELCMTHDSMCLSRSALLRLPRISGKELMTRLRRIFTGIADIQGCLQYKHSNVHTHTQRHTIDHRSWWNPEIS